MVYTHDREQVLILKRTTNVEFIDFRCRRFVYSFTVLVPLKKKFLVNLNIQVGLLAEKEPSR